MGKYFDELKRSMELLGKQENALFIGQAVQYPGTAMTNTLVDIDKDKLIELPVCEDMQLGMCIGLSLGGYLPISIFPRWNFLILATNQLANHLDKIPEYSDYNPKIIIRTSIGSQRPLHPQAQHIDDFTDAYKKIFKTINIVRLENAEDIFPAYENALKSSGSSILVEYGDYINEK
jgi:pyruvate/2-oxoglutarate/acetoin dehydrogenase E1 component